MRTTFIALLMLAQVSCAQPQAHKNVAAIIIAEASSEGTNGMKLVAEVIQQRMRDKGWTALRVVTAGRRHDRAFSCLNHRTLGSLVESARRDEHYGFALRLAALVDLPQRVGTATRGATHYTRKEEKPYWARGKKPVVVIGHHAFYRFEHY